MSWPNLELVGTEVVPIADAPLSMSQVAFGPTPPSDPLDGAWWFRTSEYVDVRTQSTGLYVFYRNSDGSGRTQWVQMDNIRGVHQNV